MRLRPPRRPTRERPRVHVVAPSSPFGPERLALGAARLRASGFDVTDTSRVLAGRHSYLNGSDRERAEALAHALSDPDVDVVWMARGGYGLTRIVDDLALPETLPVIVGFSDVTALLGRLWRGGRRSVHGPLATTLADEPDTSYAQLLRILRGEPPAPWEISPLSPGEAEGELFAANLCVLSHLVGTSSMPDLAGAILVVEEVGERPYRIDRMLTQLLTAGCLEGLAGVVVGHMLGCDEPGDPKGDRDPAPSPLSVIGERLGALGIPIAHSLPVGHRAPNHALPVGARARLSVAEGRAELGLLEGLYG